MVDANEDYRTVKTQNAVNGTICGGSVQAGSISGDVHINVTTRNLEQSLSASGDPRRYAYYFQMGCHLGNRLGMLPLSKQGISEYGKFLAAVRRIGLSLPDLSALAESGKELGQFRDSESDTRSLVMLHVELVDTVDDQIGSQASQDEFFWFTFGKLIYRALQFRVLAAKATETPGEGDMTSEVARTYAETRADLEKLAQAPAIPTSTKDEIDEFLAELDSPNSLELLWETGQELARRCRQLLTLAGAMGKSL